MLESVEEGPFAKQDGSAGRLVRPLRHVLQLAVRVRSLAVAEAAMITRVVPQSEQTCVWVSAGVLTYKLCDRDFDCDHCPLNAALRGGSRDAIGFDRAAVSTARAPTTFPDDRYYSTGHTWVQPIDRRNGRSRFGLDGFAASLISTPLRVVREPARILLHRGDTICEIELEFGALPIAIPLVSHVRRWNPALAADPAAVVIAPYDEGWVAELEPTAADGFGDLFAADEARKQARLDTRRFRRRIGLELLFDEDNAGLSPADDETLPVSDLRRILGGPQYLAVVREMIH